MAERMTREELGAALDDAISQTWNMGTCANELMEDLRVAMSNGGNQTLPIEETIAHWGEVLDRANEYVNGFKRKHERRVADEPWWIPCKLCGKAFGPPEVSYGRWLITHGGGASCLSCAYAIDGATQEEVLARHKRLSGRRVTDWREP